MKYLESIRQLTIWIGFILIGGSAGYIYYAEIGCELGSCPISADPVNSILWGGFMGAVAGMPRIEKIYKNLVKKADK